MLKKFFTFASSRASLNLTRILQENTSNYITTKASFYDFMYLFVYIGIYIWHILISQTYSCYATHWVVVYNTARVLIHSPIRLCLIFLPICFNPLVTKFCFLGALYVTALCVNGVSKKPDESELTQLSLIKELSRSSSIREA